MGTVNEGIQDRRNSTEWAIAFVGGFSAVVSVQMFMLANRETGRAHRLDFVGGGLTMGVTVRPGLSATRTVPGNLGYKSFRTRRPVQFADFDGRGAQISEVVTPLFARTYFMINDGIDPRGRKLVTLEMGGWSLPKLKKMRLSGQLGVHGVLHIRLGDGKPHGIIQHVLSLPDDPRPPGPVMPYVRSSPSEPPLLAFPDDVLFDFDSDVLKPSASPVLAGAMVTIEMRKRRQVILEGHTDSIGRAAYNLDLSLRRARAVRQWLIVNGCQGARHFTARGRGEEQPLASNKLPGGADNKAGRARNRRVEIHFKD